MLVKVLGVDVPYESHLEYRNLTLIRVSLDIQMRAYQEKAGKIN